MLEGVVGLSGEHGGLLSYHTADLCRADHREPWGLWVFASAPAPLSHLHFYFI